MHVYISVLYTPYAVLGFEDCQMNLRGCMNGSVHGWVDGGFHFQVFLGMLARIDMLIWFFVGHVVSIALEYCTS